MEDAIKFLRFVEDNYYYDSGGWYDANGDDFLSISREELYKIYLEKQDGRT